MRSPALDGGRPRRACVLSRLLQQGQIDVTMLGNLIYMIEMGRHDIAGLLRWLTWFSARHAVWLERIASAGTNADNSRRRSSRKASDLSNPNGLCVR